MSVLVTSLLVGCGVLLGRIIAKSGDRETAAQATGEEHASDADAPPPEPGEKPKPEAASPALERFPCQLGDVILRGAGDEAWLAGAVLLREGQDVVAALFVAPDAGGDRAVLARPPPSDELLWLAPEQGIAAVAGEPPTVLEVAGDRFERKRRLPLAAERVGSGAPDVGRQVILAEYTGLGDDRLVVIAGAASEGRRDATWAWRGPALLAGSYDVLPSDKG